ncbi:1-phosphofructokinase family hexose kinase [Rhodococcus zopfii]|uniref:1-phosphofructokinase family hexose kinase n=1 Tax=Rhodococcus zopfii TaxID=43772 RepID=UPI000935376A|nr:PfkB family carbohydrate kinase [Rhodococcus zopfii]
MPEDTPSVVPNPSVFVFAPSPLLTVTIECAPDGSDELHVHAGGQGVWIARMAATLGAEATLCGVFGGETGRIVRHALEYEGISVRGVDTSGANGGYVHDRRGGERVPIAQVDPTVLTRHEADDLFALSLESGLCSDVAVLGGPHSDTTVPPEMYGRLARDLHAMGIPVVADLSGPTLTSVLAGSPTVLKVAHDDLIEDGRAASDDAATLEQSMRRLAEEGARNVVVSRAGEPALALVDDRFWEVTAPPLTSVDHRGAGDSMTAGIATALARGESLIDALRWGAAVGAMNITRRGLATGRRDLATRLVGSVGIRRADGEES